MTSLGYENKRWKSKEKKNNEIEINFLKIDFPDSLPLNCWMDLVLNLSRNKKKEQEMKIEVFDSKHCFIVQHNLQQNIMRNNKNNAEKKSKINHFLAARFSSLFFFFVWAIHAQLNVSVVKFGLSQSTNTHRQYAYAPICGLSEVFLYDFSSSSSSLLSLIV